MAEGGKYNFDFTGKVVLVVEDNHISFKLMNAVLSKVKIGIIHAPNGRKAIQACEGDQPIDVVLMDLQLPEINGLDATRQIKKLRPELPVIATTANTFDADQDACMDAGCSAYITKPLQFKKLFEMMQDFFNQPE